ncbi:Glycerol-3-phosphate acyltransferase [Hibiscus syriacus]|uniref:Glycerol-3-phosphate acyltransferase, chloroplastic n=1 Tax=Hibiscus syriacus TaxID=106335 RepID=A0A6A3CED3_HIBSY|nr:glycerol-3-phosphate acyltransferase, chloroplastic-like [Hibiscus syriacus]KAE8727057.1 Glycerol-3-phosphate acyltransferase [Hibiscus syriacus]
MSGSRLQFFINISTSSPPFSFSLNPPRPFSSFLIPFQRVKLFRSTAEATLFVTAKAMAELVKHKESGVAAAGTTEGGKLDVEHSRTFIDARSEEEVLSGIKKEVEVGRLPPNVAAGMEEFFWNYKNAVFQSRDPAAAKIVLSNMAVALDLVLLDVEDPFVFQPYHKALREPFDYYMFGQNYIRPLIDFRNSYVGNLFLFYEIEEKLKQGHNVVLISNHQTEADPAVIALLLEKTNPHIAENLIYVAGDRVITDPLCKPFSMGRNLICVYSKKHMYDVPELADTKRKANIRSLKEMAMLLRTGSKLVWIAPSGGRDRPNPVTEEWYPAPFDSSSVDNMRRLIESSGTPGHMYPLALLCHDIMPPPSQVEKEIGEQRIIAFHGTGLSVAPEIAAAGEKSEEVKDAYTQALYKSVTDQYNVLKSAIHGEQGLEASTEGVALSQTRN